MQVNNGAGTNKQAANKTLTCMIFSQINTRATCREVKGGDDGGREVDGP
jgi:hypothetical protein